jgi:hypothetical protein
MNKKKHYIYAQHLKFKRRKCERLKIKSKDKKRNRNIINNKKRRLSVKKYAHRNNIYSKPQTITINAAHDLSLLKNTEKVLSFINEIDTISSNKRKTILNLDLSNVSSIDIGCINMILSKITKLGKKNIQTICKLPQNNECKYMFFESGFSDHMRDLQGRKINYSKKNNNLIVNRGFDKTSNHKIGLAIRESVLHLTGKDESYRPLYSMAQEMCANSVEHANKRDKNWLFSVWYKSESEICFIMTDIGEGILGTLKRKFSQIIKDLFLFDNKEILLRAFEKKYDSSTKDINRNKGLPKIKKIADEKFVNNLIVIANDVLLDFSNGTNSKILKQKFKGTFYYWELNKNCIETWKSRNVS